MAAYFLDGGACEEGQDRRQGAVDAVMAQLPWFWGLGFRV